MRSPLTAKPGPDTAHRVPGFWDGARYQGGQLATAVSAPAIPTMESRFPSANSVATKYLFCGVENRPMW